jgi:hypothetical protein
MDQSVRTLTNIVSYFNPAEQEEFMTKVAYTPEINLWWQQKLAQEYKINDSRVEYNNWKGLFKYYQLHGKRESIAKATDDEVGYLEVLAKIGLLQEPDGKLAELDTDYTFLSACDHGYSKLATWMMNTTIVTNTAILLQGFNMACRKGYLIIVKEILKKPGIDLRIDNYTGFIWAVKANRYDVVKYLLTTGGDVRAQGYLPLRLAVVDAGKLFTLLFSKLPAAEVNFFDAYLLRKASEFGHVDLVRQLIAEGADVNALNGEPFFLAATHNHLDVVEVLIAAGADVSRPGVARAFSTLLQRPKGTKTEKLLSILTRQKTPTPDVDIDIETESDDGNQDPNEMDNK